MLIDTHAHLDFPEFADDLPAVLRRAADAGAAHIITIGTGVESSRRAVALAEQFDPVYAAVGVHPGNADREPDDAVRQLAPLTAHPKVVAIGECGIDYHHLPERDAAEGDADYERRLTPWRERQRRFFQQQLALAADRGLNVIVHQRRSWDDTLTVLAPWHGKVRAVFHCFGENLERANLLLRNHHLVSITGIVTFKNAQTVRDTVSGLPDGTFMVETDSPYLAPVPHRGKRCEPAFVRQTAEAVAALRGQDLASLAAATGRTAEAFFRFPPAR
ncbi:MAG: TatD family hydrolase [Verrucomicrobiales bacterium]|jgi:TatD DNase family protein|nr:TatD family hydrolase [Verrucomicrobiales bacterium]